MIIENKCPQCKKQDYSCDDMEQYNNSDGITTVTWCCWCPRCRVEWNYTEYYRLYRSEMTDIKEMQDWE